MSSALVFAVDDDPVTLRGLSALFAEETEWELCTFGSAEEVRAAAGERPPDAVIANQRLGGKDGLSLLEELAGDDPHLVWLLATESADPEGSGEALGRIGPLRQVQKPFEPSDLLPKLGAALERRTLSRALAETRAELAQRDRALRASRLQIERTAEKLASTSTELETATERLVEAEQLAAVGRVIAGLAHEIGGQLALVGYAEAIKARVAGDAELCDLADVLVAAQKRLAAMVEQIRDFTSGPAGTLEREPADLAAMVDEALGILYYDRDVRGRNLERLYKDKPLVALHREKFSQVIINLVANAVQATEAGDTITLELGVFGEGDYADLTVKDRGAGMAPEVLERLGEPFFTTRPGRGSGLGVGICMRIVEEHGGSLTYCSDVGRGTIARVRLPVLGGGVEPR